MKVVERAHSELGWPEPAAIFAPTGAAHRIQLTLATEKIGARLRALQPNIDIQIGLLTHDSSTDATKAPIALVAQFHSPVSDDILREVHRLAWNFCSAPLLFTIEPHLLRAWTCCEPPEPLDRGTLFDTRVTPELTSLRSSGDVPFQKSVAQTLHWLNLVTGKVFEDLPDRFDRAGCADRLLLSNLSDLRMALIRAHLTEDTAHDLIARLIFVQFLFQRRDSSGVPALTARKLVSLYHEGVLSRQCSDFADLLRDIDDTYAFFRWLNDRFNGDLFPGSGQDAIGRDGAWAAERNEVHVEHLRLVSEFVSGALNLANGQRYLWQQYSFDVIPLEFISSIYEEFVSKRTDHSIAGTVYTPGHLVDFMLDRVLPWNSIDWDVKVLDPACGSGIFLVKAYERLIHRWKLAHGSAPRPVDLRDILANNIFGVDIDRHAVRVASFSLYLAMCDAIDPRHYWSITKFPVLRNRSIIHGDFFDDLRLHIRPTLDLYDIVIGNAPWGRNTAKTASLEKIRAQGWEPAGGSVGPLFLPKAMSLLKAQGSCAMLQEAGILTKSGRHAVAFRKRFFAEYTVDQVVNLSALRFGLFSRAVAPACVLFVRLALQGAESITYICPHGARNADDGFRISIDELDVQFISRQAAMHDPKVWTTFMWGDAHDEELIKRLSRNPNLGAAKRDGRIKTREGFIRGDRKRIRPDTLNARLLETDEFPAGTHKWLSVNTLDRNSDTSFHSRDSSDFAAFQPPQLLIKQAWQRGTGRISAALTRPTDAPVLCGQSYLTVHTVSADMRLLETAWTIYNSALAVYYLFRTSARLASYRPEPTVGEILSLPLPTEPLSRSGRSFPVRDSDVFAAFGLRESEIALVEDMVDFTLPDFAGRRPPCPPNLDELKLYCEFLLRVLRSSFGPSTASVRILTSESVSVPVQLIVVNLAPATGPDVEAVPLSDTELLREALVVLSKQHNGEGDDYSETRVVRLYKLTEVDGKRSPTVLLLKPNLKRYWLRSVAMRDADHIAADILTWDCSEENDETIAETADSV